MAKDLDKIEVGSEIYIFREAKELTIRFIAHVVEIDHDNGDLTVRYVKVDCVEADGVGFFMGEIFISRSDEDKIVKYSYHEIKEASVIKGKPYVKIIL